MRIDPFSFANAAVYVEMDIFINDAVGAASITKLVVSKDTSN